MEPIRKQKIAETFVSVNTLMIFDMFQIILPCAEVPRDQDIVSLPPGPFYIKIELFLFVNFSMYIEQNLIAVVPMFVVKC